MKAVCGKHPGCGWSQSCRSNRPVGKLWAWLGYAHEPLCDNKAEHKAYKPPFDECKDARHVFSAMVGSNHWLEKEPFPGSGSESEPRQG